MSLAADFPACGANIEMEEPLQPPCGDTPLRLLTLGRIALIRASGEEVLLPGHRRELALLAYLAQSAQPVERDTLAATFWPADRSENARRHSLRTALSFLRGIVGRDALSANRTAVELASDRVSTDIVEFLAAARDRDFTNVLALYRGTFLEGVCIPDCPRFDDWVEQQRSVFLQTALRAADIHCKATATARDWDGCAITARRWLELDPRSTEAALHLLNSVRAPGTDVARRAALAAYDDIVGSYPENVDVDSRLIDLARRLQARVATEQIISAQPRTAGTGAVAATEPGGTSTSAPSEIDPASGKSGALSLAANRPWGRRRAAMAVAALGLIAAATAYAASRPKPAPSAPSAAHPVIAIASISSVRGDTASTWLEDGLPQMITADLSRSSTVEMIGAVRVRAARNRTRLGAHGTLSRSQAIRFGNELGATVVVSGNFTRLGDKYVLGISTVDVTTGKPLGTFTVSSSSPITVANWAASRIIDLVMPGGGARFAEVETANVAAYQHFTHALEATSEGQFADSKRELDAAILLDSGFASALSARLEIADDEGDAPTAEHIRRLMLHARLTPRDQLLASIDSARDMGDTDRMLQVARELVDKYPHDPRGYATLAAIYQWRGDWGPAEATARQALELDSLANQAGDGPCATCVAYGALANIQVARGDLAAAEKTARRWLQLQPDLPAAWASLADILGYAGRGDAAQAAYQHATLLSGDDPVYVLRTARIMIMGRRFPAADSVLSRVRSDLPSLRLDVADLKAMSLRSRGELEKSNAMLTAQLARNTNIQAFWLEKMDALGRMGEYAAVGNLFAEHLAGPQVDWTQLHGNAARDFCWTRAMEASALAGSGDTLRLRAIADSIRIVGARSYFERDRRLYHHVLGLVAMHGSRYAEAEHEFQAARIAAAGWTETVAWLARAQLAEGKPGVAVATLRDAYKGPLDAMGRYEPLRELDSLMTVAFHRAGMADSAAKYLSYGRMDGMPANVNLH